MRAELKRTAELAATKSVLESTDHYRASRYVRLLKELEVDEVFPPRIRKKLESDRQLAEIHAHDLKGGS